MQRFAPEVENYVNFDINMDDEWEDDDDCECDFADKLVQPQPTNLFDR